MSKDDYTDDTLVKRTHTRKDLYLYGSAYVPALSRMESLLAFVNSPPTSTSLKACAFSSASPPVEKISNLMEKM